MHRVDRFVGLVAVGTLCGCALFHSAEPLKKSHRGWISSGVLAVSRPVPEVGAAQVAEPAMLGFMPNKHSSSGASVVVDRASRTLHLISSAGEQIPFSAEGAEGMRPGVYNIVLKQTEPVWYAPPSYFELRGLRVPGEGDKERFRRGALGSRALFIDGDTSIHEGPVQSAEVGGLRLAPEDMTTVFDSLPIGARVEVR